MWPFNKKKEVDDFTEQDLLDSVKSSNWELAIQIVNSGISPNLKDEHGVPIFHWVAVSLHGQVIFAFMDNGAELDARDTKGVSAAQYVLSFNEVKMGCPSKKAWSIARNLAIKTGEKIS